MGYGAKMMEWVVIYNRHCHSNYSFCKFIQTLRGVIKLLFILLLTVVFNQTNVTSKMISYNLEINGN